MAEQVSSKAFAALPEANDLYTTSCGDSRTIPQRDRRKIFSSCVPQSPEIAFIFLCYQ